LHEITPRGDIQLAKIHFYRFQTKTVTDSGYSSLQFPQTILPIARREGIVDRAGLTVRRFVGKSKSGRESSIRSNRFVADQPIAISLEHRGTAVNRALSAAGTTADCGRSRVGVAHDRGASTPKMAQFLILKSAPPTITMTVGEVLYGSSG